MSPVQNHASNNSAPASEAMPRSESLQRKRKFQRRSRRPISCEPCRASKLRCDRCLPCSSCTRRDRSEMCNFSNKSLNSKSHAAPSMSPQTSQNAEEELTTQPTSSPLSGTDHARPESVLTGDQPQYSNWETMLQRPIDQLGCPVPEASDLYYQSGSLSFPFPYGPKATAAELLSCLPPTETCEYLITQYFLRLSPFFHILHGPTFQKQYQAFRRDSSSVSGSWLALLLVICSATINTMDDNDPALADIMSTSPQAGYAEAASQQYRVVAMMYLCRDNFMVHHNLNTLEALLVLIYTISHNEGVDRSWTLLGVALNIGIALRCNATKIVPEHDCIDVERRRRCWAGILMLHTYQAILFRDTDISFLNLRAIMPTDVDDDDILEDKVREASKKSTQMSVTMFKIRLFQLSTQVCHEMQDTSLSSEERLLTLDSQISDEQQKWDAAFLVNGYPSLLDTASYAHWCVLQLYAHQLFLQLHRPFSRLNTTNSHYRSASRTKCITSSASLLDIHRQFLELPRFRHYRWYARGMSCLCALHGAVTLASCLLEDTDDEFGGSPYRAIFDAAVVRIGMLQERSPVCVKAFPVLRYMQSLLSPEQFQWSSAAGPEFGNTFDNWIDTVQWFNLESVDWTFWDNVLNSQGS